MASAMLAAAASLWVGSLPKYAVRRPSMTKDSANNYHMLYKWMNVMRTKGMPAFTADDGKSRPQVHT
jgi:hypothetical protein